MTPQTCSSGPVVSTQYVKLVRSQCPSAYSYAYDDLAALVKFWFLTQYLNESHIVAMI